METPNWFKKVIGVTAGVAGITAGASNAEAQNPPENDGHKIEMTTEEKTGGFFDNMTPVEMCESLGLKSDQNSRMEMVHSLLRSHKIGFVSYAPGRFKLVDAKTYTGSEPLNFEHMINFASNEDGDITFFVNYLGNHSLDITGGKLLTHFQNKK